MSAVIETHGPGLLRRGKVRDVYELEGRRLLIVATDRISAFDVVMNEPVPDKGVILTQLSAFWLRTLPACEPHHMLELVGSDNAPEGFDPRQVAGRGMVVRRAEILPVECVVRGYLIGGGWREYQQTGCVSGIRLPAGLRQAEKFDEPLFTPSTKAEQGHDEPISFDQAVEIARQFARRLGYTPEQGERWMHEARDRSLRIYAQARDYAEPRGIILADTKFEFGIADGRLVLADEVLTPDSSRFWPADAWRPGTNPPSFDKQFLRDYLATLDWPRTYPPPPIPPDVVERTRQRYLEAYRRLTGVDLPGS